MAAPVWWDTKAYNPRQPRIPGGQTGGGRWGGGIVGALSDAVDSASQPGPADYFRQRGYTQRPDGWWTDGVVSFSADQLDMGHRQATWKSDVRPHLIDIATNGHPQDDQRLAADIGDGIYRDYHPTVAIYTNDAGDRAVVKSQYNPQAVEREVWSDRFAEALDAPVPRAAKVDGATLAYEYVEGKHPVVEVEDYNGFTIDMDDAVFMLAAQTPEGRRLALFEAVIAAEDRHELNYIVTPDGRLIGIDYEAAWLDDNEDEMEVDGVASYVSDFTMEELDEAATALTSMEDMLPPKVFEAAFGRLRWFQDEADKRSEKSIPPPWWTKDFNPAQPRIPAGKPGGGRWGGDIGATLLDTIANIESTGQTPGGGNYYRKVKVVTDDQGRRAVVKAMPYGSEGKDAELLTSRLGAALGASVPIVVDADTEGIAMEFIDGKHLSDDGAVTAVQDDDWPVDSVLKEAAKTPAGRRLALLETVVDAADRHALNYLFTDSDDPGSIVGIDYEMGLDDPDLNQPLWMGGSVLADSFGIEAYPNSAAFEHTFTVAEVALARKAVDAVKDDFTAAGRAKWWPIVDARVQALEAALEAKSVPPPWWTKEFIEANVVRDIFGRFAPKVGDLIARTVAQPDAGFTYQPLTRRSPKRGMAVSPYPERERSTPVGSFTEDYMVAYFEDNLDLLGQPDHYLGGWHNPDNDTVVLDISVVVPTAEEAIALSRQYDQQAYYDLGAGEVHEVIAGAATRRAEEGKSASPPWWSDSWGLDRGGGPRSGPEPPGEDPGRLTKSAPPSWWETKRRPWVERLHPRSDDGRFSLRGFDVVRTDPLSDMAKHVGKPWYGVDDWSDVTVDLDKHFATAEAYEALPEWDDAAKPNYDAFITELDVQYETLTKELGIKVEVMDTDPYPDVQAMMADVRDNRTIKVLSTKATPPGHAYLTDDENDRFRAVHDAFGHAGTGRGFDRHGEEAAYQAHANMFTQQARLALATETRGQNAVLIRSAVLTGKGDFPSQKFAVLDPVHTKAAPVPSDRNDDITDVERRNTSLGRHPRNMTAEEMDAWRARRAQARGLTTKSTPPSWWTKAYNPQQPRIPGGQTGGGRWGGGIVGAAAKILDLPPPATSRAPELWGRNDLGLVFPDRGYGPSPSALTPWPPAAKRRPHGQFDPAPVRAALLDPPPTTLVDPRSLHSTQPGLQYPAADYYLNDEAYNETGRTFADGAQAGNRVPVVYRRPGPFGEQLLLLSGHHRGLAALLKGQPLEAVVVEGS